MAKDIILIHGTWGNGPSMNALKIKLEKLGFNVHTPSLRYHDIPYDEALKKVGDVSLMDYMDDIISIVETCEEPPIVLGHSLGTIVAQMVAQRVDLAGLVLLGTAPTSDMFAFYPGLMISFFGHFLQWNFWKKPLEPNKRAVYKYAMPKQHKAMKDRLYAETMPESGLAYTEVVFSLFDPKNAATIDRSQINCPILIVVGTDDLLTVPKIAKDTVEKYGDQAKAVMIDGADHYYVEGLYTDQVVYQIERWWKEVRH